MQASSIVSIKIRRVDGGRETVPRNTLGTCTTKRDVTREYEAIVIGTMTAGGMIDKPIGRHSTKRTLMSVSPMANMP